MSGFSNTNVGVSGTTAGTSFNVAGVYGEATGSSGTVVGVHGKATNDPLGTGVAGLGNAVGGYFQAGGKGVHGVSTSDSGFGGVFSNTAGGMVLKAEGNVVQDRGSGGFVKAMALIDPHQPAGSNPAGSNIVHCYNSQATGSAVSTPPCGFSYTEVVLGGYNIDFGFKVDDRFISVIPFEDGGTIGANITYFPSANFVQMATFYPTEVWFDKYAQPTRAKFFIMVY
ncbi:MAG TPA: hypothetical protein VKF81_04630 [Blastocatellia bacterium]|nr:hypothetical protein [Blastocatellia bacterium]